MNFWAVVAELPWAVAVVFLVLFFRRQIRQAAERLQEAKAPGGFEAVFGAPGAEPPATQAAEVPEWTPAERRLGRKVDREVEAQWSNTGNIFWLGKDLTEAVYAFQLGAEKRILLFMLNQSRHHVRSLNFTDKHFEEILTEMLEIVERRPEAELDKETRQRFAKDMILLSNEIGAHMEAHQPGFQGWPSQA
jgi:hypothetical protein